MTLAEFVSDPARMAAYREWLKNPMTRQVLDLLSDFFGPIGLPLDRQTGESALYYAGGVDMAAKLLRTMGSMDRVVEEQKQFAALKSLEADYGAAVRLKQGEPV